MQPLLPLGNGTQLHQIVEAGTRSIEIQSQAGIEAQETYVSAGQLVRMAKEMEGLGHRRDDKINELVVAVNYLLDKDKSI